MAPIDKTRTIPSLDGMRAISILLVIIGHSSVHVTRWIQIPPSFYLVFAHTGVSVFFVISGFLITRLLLKELEETGTIGLKRFYLRRAFRIAPPFYLYLAVVLGLVLAGVFHTPLRAFIFAAIYASNYYLGPGGDFIGLQHIWSLSVEEQFYLLWPAVLLLVGKQRAIKVAGCLILVSPLSRVATYLLLVPEHRAVVDRMFHSSIDTIMSGCLLALVWQNQRVTRVLGKFAGPRSTAVAIAFLFLLDPTLTLFFRGRYTLVFGMTLQSIAICLITFRVVTSPEKLTGQILNTQILRHIGIVSYSLYLWQNILTATATRYFLINLVGIVVCAELSYWLVERPSLQLRDRICRKNGGPGGEMTRLGCAETR